MWGDALYMLATQFDLPMFNLAVDKYQQALGLRYVRMKHSTHGKLIRTIE